MTDFVIDTPPVTARPVAAGRNAVSVNGALGQEGDLNQMILKVPKIASHLSEYFEPTAGKVILSGTPAGVGTISREDAMEAVVEGLGAMTVRGI